MKVESNKFIFFILSITGLFIAGISSFILPDRFFNDTNIYIYDRFNEIGFVGGYPLSILFYKVTGLRHLHFSYIGIIQYSLLILLIYKLGVPKSFGKLNIKNFIVYIGFLILAIFLSMPTKEFITFFYTALIVFLFKNRNYSLNKTIVISLILLILFSYFFREYYILVVITSVFLFGLNKIKFKSKNGVNILFGLLFIITISLSYGAVKGVFLSQNTRESINAIRVAKGDANSNSAIISPIDTNTWYGESFGVIYGFFTVNLPFNSILTHIFSPQIVAFSFWQLFLFVIIYKRYGVCINLGKKNNYDLWLFYFLISYFIVQGVFEPDLGSAIRHKAGIFPLIYYLMYYEEFRKKLS